MVALAKAGVQCPLPWIPALLRLPMPDLPLEGRWAARRASGVFDLRGNDIEGKLRKVSM